MGLSPHPPHPSVTASLSARLAGHVTTAARKLTRSLNDVLWFLCLEHGIPSRRTGTTSVPPAFQGQCDIQTQKTGGNPGAGEEKDKLVLRDPRQVFIPNMPVTACPAHAMPSQVIMTDGPSFPPCHPTALVLAPKHLLLPTRASPSSHVLGAPQGWPTNSQAMGKTWGGRCQHHGTQVTSGSHGHSRWV